MEEVLPELAGDLTQESAQFRYCLIGFGLAAALGDTANPSLMLDVRHNYSMLYRDQMKARLSNNRRRAAAGASPLDGMSAKDAMD